MSSGTPTLPRDRMSGSWMITWPDTGRVTETFSEALARSALHAGLRVETAYQYLIRINAAAHQQAGGQL